MLPVINVRRITSVLSEAFVKPPPFCARFSRIVVSSTVNSPLEALWIPPPSSTALLFRTITRWKVTLAPLFSTPPPSISDELRSTSVSRTSTWPWLSMAEPAALGRAGVLGDRPPVISTGPPSVYTPPPPASLPSSPGTPALFLEKVESRTICGRSLAV